MSPIKSGPPLFATRFSVVSEMQHYVRNPNRDTGHRYTPRSAEMSAVSRRLHAYSGVAGDPGPLRIEIASWATCYAQNAVDLVLHSGVRGFRTRRFLSVAIFPASSSGTKIVIDFMYSSFMMTLDALGYSSSLFPFPAFLSGNKIYIHIPTRKMTGVIIVLSLILGFNNVFFKP